MVGRTIIEQVVKQSVIKASVMSNACLRREELEEVIFKLEIYLTNRPLKYVNYGILVLDHQPKQFYAWNCAEAFSRR